MKEVWAAVLITYGVSTIIAMDSGQPRSNVFPLDMVQASVDDMYNGCKDDMKSKVAEYLKEETKEDSKFKRAWEEAEKTYDRKWRKKSTKLEKKQVMAIYVYSFGRDDIYRDFNDAVRTQNSVYKTNFGYHTLHYYLTIALQGLNARQLQGNREYTTVRGVDQSFSTDVLNKEVRFGSFASSTKAGYKIALKFGSKSCFKIVTRFGADISMYSKYENEAEVLIPPYEVFKVTKIKKKSEDQNLPCDVVYELKSTRTLSNLNCALFQK